MKLVKFSINRPVSVFMFTVAAVIFGFISYSRLTLNLLPKISYPTLTVKTEYPGTAPSEIENIISKPSEKTCGVGDNVMRISSVSRAELSEVTIEFAWHTNMDFATLKVREKLDLLRFPTGATKPAILRSDPIPTVASRLSQENVDLSAGILKQKDTQFLVRTVNQFKDVEEIKGIIVEKRGDAQITLGTLAEVFRGFKERKVISRINGRECIEAAIYRAADANTVSLVEAVRGRL